MQPGAMEATLRSLNKMVSGPVGSLKVQSSMYCWAQKATRLQVDCQLQQIVEDPAHGVTGAAQLGRHRSCPFVASSKGL